MFQILVVEDDKELNRTVCSFLNHMGYQSTGCLDANEAYDALCDTLFNLIISDIMLPGMDGFEFAQSIRDINKEIPILFMTGRNCVLAKVGDRSFCDGCRGTHHLSGRRRNSTHQPGIFHSL